MEISDDLKVLFLTMNLNDPEQFVDVHSHNHELNSGVLKLINLRIGHDEIGINDGGFYSLGIHPWDILQNDDLESRLNLLRRTALKKEVLAIGETGIDRVYKETLLEQKKSFETHLELARTLNKPVILHAVRAHSDILETLKKMNWSKENIPLIHHDYRGGLQTTKQYAQFNCYFSFGISLWSEGEHIAVFKDLKLEKIFLETDDQCQYKIEDIYQRASELRVENINLLKLMMRDNFLNLLKPKG